MDRGPIRTFINSAQVNSGLVVFLLYNSDLITGHFGSRENEVRIDQGSSSVNVRTDQGLSAVKYRIGQSLNLI